MKTKETLDIEKKLYASTIERGVYGAFEVTFGRERVDYITVNRKGIWRAYEIKVTKSDFYSKAKKSFVGNYNYYVMPEWLYELVKNDIPSHIGVTDGSWCLKKPKKVPLSIPHEVLSINLICALSREAGKYYENLDEDEIAKYKRIINRLEKDIEKHRNNSDEWMDKYYDLEEKIDNLELLQEVENE